MTESDMHEGRDSESEPDHQLDREELLALARDKSKQGRTNLVNAIKDLYDGSESVLTEQDRALISDVLRRLIHDVEVSVRHGLAEFFAERPDAPPDLVRTLAHDDIDVAYPVLSKSEALQDPDLIEVIAFRTMEHRLAVAVRKNLSEDVSGALVSRGEERVVTTLLENPGARISDDVMGGLVEQSAVREAYQKPLVNREDLPRQLAGRLYWMVSAALRQHIMDKFEIDPNELDAEIETVIGKMAESAGAANEARRKLVEEATGDDAAPSHFTDLLRRGQIAQFIAIFAKITHLRDALVKRILFEPGGEGLAIACKAERIDRAEFATIFATFRLGRLGDHQFESNEVARAVGFFDQLDRSQAVSVVQRWRRNQDFQNAIRVLEESQAKLTA